MVRAADTVQAPKPGKNILHLPGGENGPVHLIIFHNRNPAAVSLPGHYRDSCLAQVFDVPIDGPPGHLEPFGKAKGRGCLLL